MQKFAHKWVWVIFARTSNGHKMEVGFMRKVGTRGILPYRNTKKTSSQNTNYKSYRNANTSNEKKYMCKNMIEVRFMRKVWTRGFLPSQRRGKVAPQKYMYKFIFLQKNTNKSNKEYIFMVWLSSLLGDHHHHNIDDQL